MQKDCKIFSNFDFIERGSIDCYLSNSKQLYGGSLFVLREEEKGIVPSRPAGNLQLLSTTYDAGGTGSHAFFHQLSGGLDS